MNLLRDITRRATSGPEGRRMRVLLIAEAANPKLTSVALIGWQFARALSAIADVHLVSELRNASDIEAAGLGNMQFTPVDNRLWQGLAWKLARGINGKSGLGWGTYTALCALAYPQFERKAWKIFAQRLRQGEFDVVHRITPNSPITTSYLAERCAEIGVPFVLGPLNGGVPWPKEFPELRKAEKEWLAPLRGLAKFNPGYWSTRRGAKVIVVGAAHAKSEMPAEFHDKTVILSENAVDAEAFSPAQHDEVRLPLHTVFIGRLVPYKGADILIEAAAPLIREGRITLEIIGDGPEAPKLRQLAEKLNVAVQFPGWVAQQDLRAHLAKAHIFAFPSLHEFGGGVVLEAMAMGLVPIVLNYGGPPELLAPGCGVRVPMGNRDTIVTGFREALAGITKDLPQLQQTARAVRSHVVASFTWAAKARQLMQVYEWAMGFAERPQFMQKAQVQAPTAQKGGLVASNGPAVQSPVTVICPGIRPGVANLASNVPLVLLPICGKPAIAYLMEHLAERKLRHVRLIVCDRPEMVQAFIGRGEQWGLNIEIAIVPEEPAEHAVQINGTTGEVIRFEELPQIPGLPLWGDYAGWARAFAAASTLVKGTSVGMREIAPGVFIATNAFIADTAQVIAPCWIGPNAHVASGAIVGPYAAVEEGSYIDLDSRVVRGVVGPRTYVGKGFDVVESVVWGSEMLSLKDGTTLQFADSFMVSPIGLNEFEVMDRFRTMVSNIFS